MRVLGISGSLRSESYNTRLLSAAASLLPDGAEFVVYEGLKDLPPYDEDDDRDPAPAEVERLRSAILEADGLLVATPEYNSSIPGQLKNALDWASRPAGSGALRNKNAAVIGASTSMFGAVWAQAEVRKVLRASGARVIDRELPVGGASEAWDLDGRLVDLDLRAELIVILDELQAQVDRTLAAA
jgi:chromate reductase